MQALKSFCLGGSNVTARKSALAAAGGLAAFDAVLAACEPCSPANSELRTAAMHVKLLVSTESHAVGGRLLFLTPLPCSNSDCTRALTSRCSVCSAPYCSAACQRAHWPIHKKECKARAAARAASGISLKPDDVSWSLEQVRASCGAVGDL